MDMALDTNVVTFRVNSRDGDLPQAVAPAKAVDAVRQAWRQVQQERQIQAAEITGVHSTWQASRTDRVFLAGKFPGAEYTYQFDRPEGDDWSEAFERAREAMALPQSNQEPQPEVDASGEWLPILHTYDGPLKVYASLPLVDGRLYLGFARTTVRPTGRIGMSHLLRNTFEEMSEDEFLKLAGEACRNLKRGLSFMEHPDAEKGPLVTLERGEYNLCAASAIVLDDFHRIIAEQVGETS